MKTELIVSHTEMIMSSPMLQLAKPAIIKRLAIGACLALLLLLYTQREHASIPTFRYSQSPVEPNTTQHELIPFSGFSNIRVPNGPACEDIKIPDQELQVLKTKRLEVDIVELALSIKSPMLDYSGLQGSLSLREKMRATWSHMYGTSVWLAKSQVFFSITRVFHHQPHDPQMPIISFLYAQVYNSQWIEQTNFTIPWHGNNLTFPRVLDIESPYKVGETYYGTEDPRMVLEPGKDEPVIIFNQITDVSTTKRPRFMHLHMPFSNITTQLRIRNEKPRESEKNWSPFFMNLNRTPEQLAWPAEYIYFIYNYDPLEILRCYITNGMCEFVYKQGLNGKAWDEYKKPRDYGDTKGAMRGATNYIPLSFSPGPGIASYVGWSRSHADAACEDGATYRGFLTVLSTNSTHFWLEYSSESLDFGHSILNDDEYNDICVKGRILLPNSVSKFDEQEDTMTTTFSVGDTRVHALELSGVRKLIEQLPQFAQPAPVSQLAQSFNWHLNVTFDVIKCAIISASDYNRAWWNVTDRSHGPNPTQSQLAQLHQEDFSDDFENSGDDHDGLKLTADGLRHLKEHNESVKVT